MFCTPWRDRAEPGRTPDAKLPAGSLRGWGAPHPCPIHEPTWIQRGSPFLAVWTHPQGAKQWVVCTGSLVAPLSLSLFD